MDRKFALWFGVPTFAAMVCFLAVAHFAPTLLSGGTFLSIAVSLIALASVVGCIHAFLSIRAGASPWTALHPIAWLPLLAVFGLVGDAWGVRSALWRYATTSSLEAEGIQFARADDGNFRPQVDINGSAVNFVVDPATRYILISQADATRIGIDLSAVTFDVPIDGQSAAAITLKSVQLFSLSMHDVPAFVPEHDLAVSVLGRDFFDRTRDWGVKDDVLMVLP